MHRRFRPYAKPAVRFSTPKSRHVSPLPESEPNSIHPASTSTPDRTVELLKSLISDGSALIMLLYVTVTLWTPWIVYFWVSILALCSYSTLINFPSRISSSIIGKISVLHRRPIV